VGASRVVGTRDALRRVMAAKGCTHALPPAATGRRVVVRNSLEPESMTPAQRLEEVAGLLATGFLRLRLRGADGRKKGLELLAEPRDECIEPESEAEIDE